MLRLRRAAFDSARGGHTFELSFAHREHGSRFVIGTPWTILSQGNRYADDDH
jgi:hypothetical protein